MRSGHCRARLRGAEHRSAGSRSDAISVWSRHGAVLSRRGVLAARCERSGVVSLCGSAAVRFGCGAVGPRIPVLCRRASGRGGLRSGAARPEVPDKSVQRSAAARSAPVVRRCALPPGECAALDSAGGGSHGTAMGAGARSRRSVVVGRTAARAGAGPCGARRGCGGGGWMGTESAARTCGRDGRCGPEGRESGRLGDGRHLVVGPRGSVGGALVRRRGAVYGAGPTAHAGHQGMATPPLGRRIWPVMKADASEAR